MDQTNDEHFILLQSSETGEEGGQFPDSDSPLLVEGESTSDTLYNPPGEVEQNQPYRTMYQYMNLSQEGSVERFTFLPRQYLLQTASCDASDRGGLVTLTMDGSESGTRTVGANYVLAAQPILCAVSTGEGHNTSTLAGSSFVLSQQAGVDGNVDRSCDEVEAAAFGAVMIQSGVSDKHLDKGETEEGLGECVVDAASACTLPSAGGTEPGSLDTLPSSDSLIADDMHAVSKSRLLSESGEDTMEKGSYPEADGEESGDLPPPQPPLDLPHLSTTGPTLSVPPSQTQDSRQVFSTVRAYLSQSLLDAIPGSKTAYLRNSMSDCQVELQQSDDTFELSGALVNVLAVHNRLQHLLSAADSGIVGRRTQEKGVHCCLLKPQYSRSGREVKWRTIDMSDDDIAVDDTDTNEVRPRVTRRQTMQRKRKGRHRHVITDPAPSGESKQVDRLADTDEHMPQPPKAARLEEGSDLLETLSSTREGGQTVAGDEGLGEENLPTEEADTTETRESQGETEAEESEAKSAEVKTGTCVRLGRPKHKKNYDELNPFKFFCDQCSFKSKRRNHLEKHKKMHERNLPLHKCSRCSFTSVRKGQVQRHQLSHTSQVYNCPKCKYQTSSSHYLYKHYHLKHIVTTKKDPSTRSVLSCMYCDYKTDRLPYYERHMKCHIQKDPEKGDSLVPDYNCTMCSYRTQRKEHFMRHMNNVHMDRRPYLCDHCGKAFKRRDALKQHHLVHEDVNTRIYPFRCNVCTKGFRSQAHLTEHQTRHSTVRSYLCEICGASFKTKSVQRHHVQTIHNNPRSFHCDQCEKRFNTRYALCRHQHIHNNATVRLLEEMAVQQQQQQNVEIVMEQQVIAQLQPSAATELMPGSDHQVAPDDKIVQTISMPVTIVSPGDGAVTYEQEAVTDIQTAYAQTSEATTALLYLTNYQTY